MFDALIAIGFSFFRFTETMMNDSSTIPFMMTQLDSCQRCNEMAHPFLGLLFIGFIIKTVLAAAIIVALIWLILKLGKLADTYTKKLK
jgi:hypothetical protein